MIRPVVMVAVARRLGMAICDSSESALVDLREPLFFVSVSNFDGRYETRLGDATVIMMNGEG